MRGAKPYVDVPAFVASLKAEESVSARALEFAILTAARTGEVIGGTREEIDFESRVWTVQVDTIRSYLNRLLNCTIRSNRLCDRIAYYQNYF